jgi:hypothetical protein
MKSLYFRPSFRLVFKQHFSHLANAVARNDRISSEMNAMPLLSEHHDLAQLDHRLHQAYAVTPDLMSEVVGETCRRFPSMTTTEKGVQMARLIKSGAWTDAALALIELELPAMATSQDRL